MSQVSRLRSTARPETRLGARHYPLFLGLEAQNALLCDVASVLAAAPLFQPLMPRTGKPFSVAMTNCGALGWVSDAGGYRYQATHLVSGRAWPPIPERLLALWREVAGYPDDPEACLINSYAAGAKMGSHQDRDEADFSAPVVSVSLGCNALFHVGGLKRAGPKARFLLGSGDVFVLGGPSRLAYHGIDKIHPATSPIDLDAIAPGCCRINLTLRRVTLPARCASI